MHRCSWLGCLAILLALSGLACGSGDSSPVDYGSDLGDVGEVPEDVPDDSGADADADADADVGPVDADGDTYPEDEDCDDTNYDVNPGANELCDGVDNNCDGATDEDSATDASTWYSDVDGDSYGDPSSSRTACSEPAGYTDNDEDCNDADPAVNPDATEICNGSDDDCDGATDEDGATGATAWYPDVDGDGYGATEGMRMACEMPAGFISIGGDCDDTNDDVNPDEFELCNTIDDNCNGSIDEATAIDALTFYRDRDGDGFGNPTETEVGCLPSTGYVLDDTDCNDLDRAINPMAPDAPDSRALDSNCDGVDGDLSRSIFVSTSTGNDANTGLGTIGSSGALVVSPVATLVRALELAAICTPACDVLIAEGTYNQAGTSLAMVSGASLYGGYTTSWIRNRPTNATVISATASPTVTADTITHDTWVDRLTIQGPDITTIGGESVALLVKASPSVPPRLTLREVQVNAGRGGSGAAGSLGAAGSCTCNGGAGGTTWDCGANAGGSGGCSGGSGGGAGTSYCPHACPTYGSDSISNGGTGGAGSSGARIGTAAAANSNNTGSFNASTGDWTPNAGTAGTAGPNGGGGGGGGGGGTKRAESCACVSTMLGGTGGAGGAAGCGGGGGTAGSQGGGAFGIVLVESAISFDTTGVSLGIGGVGGVGGAGRNGGAGRGGSAGGARVEDCDCLGWGCYNSGSGGHGGTGGDGAGGGGGAGGNGGPTMGVVTLGASTIVGAPTYGGAGAAPGAGGNGGAGGLRGDGTTASQAGTNGLPGRQENLFNVP